MRAKGFRLTAAGLAAVALVSTYPTRAQEVLGEEGLKGAGSTLIYPLLSRWSDEYRGYLARGGAFPVPNAGLDEADAHAAMSYEPVGSFGGLERLRERAVDFAVTEMPLPPRELATLGLAQFPIVFGGVVVATNVAGIGPGQLKLTGPVLADVFLGRITRWSDPAIAALNPTLKLPDAPIVVVHRTHGSGTTFVFTDYLSRVSSAWKEKVGAGAVVAWPIGKPAEFNEGVAQFVRRVENSIGYVDLGSALKEKLSYAAVQNRAGGFIAPDTGTIQAALAGADWKTPSDFHLVVTNAPGEQAYPITAIVYVVMPRTASRAKTRAALDFFQWVMHNGARTATRLGCVPLPAPLVEQVEGYWARTFDRRD